MPSSDADKLLDRSKAYQIIKRDLYGRIGAQWPVGSQLPPIKELAHLIGAGFNNTHRAVRELVREGLLVSRQGHGTFVARQPNVQQVRQSMPPKRSAQELAADMTVLQGKHVAIITAASEPDAFIRNAMQGFESMLDGATCRITHGRFSSHPTDILSLHRHADAIIAINPDDTPPLILEPEQKLVVVNSGADSSVISAGGYDIICADSEQGGYVAGEHFRACGCKSVAFIGATPGTADQSYDMTSLHRLRGLQRGWGKQLGAEHLLKVGYYISQAGARATANYLAMSPRPDGLFASSDELAIGFIHGALAHGLEAGRDYQIIGFDGQARGGQLSMGQLTTIVAPMREMGELAAVQLARRFAEPDRATHVIQLGCTLRKGATTRVVG